MITDKFSLNKYVIKKKFPATYIVSSEQKEKIFRAVKPIGRKQILIYEFRSMSSPSLKIDWKIKKGLTLTTYRYNIVDRAHTPIGKIECNRTPPFSTSFTIRDIYNKEIGVIQPDQVGYAYRYFSVVLNAKKAATFFRNAHMSISYTMDLSGDKDSILDRKFALSIAIILTSMNIPMQKFSDAIDWEKSVVVGDEMYKIKRR
jgi:hypothetical protein